MGWLALVLLLILGGVAAFLWRTKSGRKVRHLIEDEAKDKLREKLDDN